MDDSASKDSDLQESLDPNCAPPSSSRLPPDGHEFPLSFQENKYPVESTYKAMAPVPQKRLSVQSAESKEQKIQPKFNNYTVNKEVPFPQWIKNDANESSVRNSFTSLQDTERRGSRWRNDEKSAGSVKDKIAIFSSSQDCEPVFPQSPNIISKKLSKTFKSSDDIFQESSRPAYTSKTPPYKTKITENSNLATAQKNDISASISDFTKYSSKSPNWKDGTMSYADRSLSSVDLTQNPVKSKTVVETPQFSTLPKKSASQETNNNSCYLSERSQSMTDVANFRIPQIYRTTSMVGYQSQDTADSRRLALNSLIEQRRRSMSKLKGLVIPEKVIEVTTNGPIVDLPEIRSINTETSSNVNKTDSVKEVPLSPHQRSHLSVNLTSPPWKSVENNNTKYSPAFKRKNLQLYGEMPVQNTNNTDNLETSCNNKSSTEVARVPKVIDQNSSFTTEYQIAYSENSKENDTAFIETIVSPTCSDCSYEFSDVNSLNVTQDITNNSLRKTDKCEIESDNDSAVSSSQSSYSKDFSSPPVSLQENFPKNEEKSDNLEKQVTKTFCSETIISPANGASNYDSLNRRILKARSVEAINRKNILASAKCRSGQDLTSPLIQRKFENEQDTVKTPSFDNLEDGRHYKESSILSDSDYSAQESSDNSLDFDLKMHRSGKFEDVPKVKKETAYIDKNNYNNKPVSRVNKVDITIINPVSKPARLSTSELKKNFEKNCQVTSPTRVIHKSPKVTSRNFNFVTSDTDETSQQETSLRFKNGSVSSLTYSDFDSLNSSTTSTSQSVSTARSKVF